MKLQLNYFLITVPWTSSAKPFHGKHTDAVEDDPAMRRYRRAIHHPLDSIVYKGWNDPTVPLFDLKTR